MALHTEPVARTGMMTFSNNIWSAVQRASAGTRLVRIRQRALRTAHLVVRCGGYEFETTVLFPSGRE
jgi:hypothetical protein